jgi:SNF2 family DNA or RNA helicase
MLSDSSTEGESPLPPRAQQRRQQLPRSPLSPLNGSQGRQPAAFDSSPRSAHKQSQGRAMALTVLEGGRDHQQPPGPPPAQPTALLVPSLYPYQAAGFGWMLRQEGVNAVAGADRYVLGGLLADEQGMGKTVQTLSLCLAHPPPLHAAPVGGSLSCAGGGSRAALGTLIVCPLNLLRQWQREIGTKAAPPYGGNVCVHHGSGRTRVAAQLASFDFVLTTYSVVRSEMAGKRARPGGSSSSAQGSSSGGSGAAQQGGGGGAQGGGGGAQGALFGLKWWRVVLDEAHSIRNGSAGISQACCALRATHRWCLTGTPLQVS